MKIEALNVEHNEQTPQMFSAVWCQIDALHGPSNVQKRDKSRGRPASQWKEALEKSDDWSCVCWVFRHLFNIEHSPD